MREHDLTRMDLEGLSYSSELLQEALKKLERLQATMESEDIADREIISLALLMTMDLEIWCRERLHDNSIAFDNQMEAILEDFDKFAEEFEKEREARRNNA